VRRGVVVSHPLRQHAYETALAAQDAGLLEAFVTGLYRTGRGLGGPVAQRLAPVSYRQALARRFHPELDPALVETVPRYQLADLALRSAPWLRARLDTVSWMDERFDRAVAGRLGRRRPGLVHCFEGSALETLRAARAAGAAAVLDVPSAHERYARAVAQEGGDPSRFPTSRLRAERACADRLVAGSDQVADCLAENGVDPGRIAVVPYGVDTDRFRPASAAGPDRPFRALFVGQVGLRKGVRYLLEAWRRLGLRNAELAIAGAADADGERLLAAAPPGVRRLGPVQPGEIDAVYRDADVFVLPTLAEGSALVAYEAMASGLPVVTTRECGSPVRDGVDGFLVPVRDVEALCDRLAALHGMPDRGRVLGRSGRRLMEDCFTWRRYRSRIEALHRELLA
jgi:glycosyltransferase involved in cell wall biosynthesis